MDEESHVRGCYNITFIYTNRKQCRPDLFIRKFKESISVQLPLLEFDDLSPMHAVAAAVR